MLTTVATFAYFAPETGKIVSAPFTQTVDPNLLEITQRWALLNNVRLAAFCISAFFVLVALNRPLDPQIITQKR